MKTVYLCGAINGCRDGECKDWREVAKETLRGRFNVLDPMRRDYRGIDDQSVKEIVNGDYADIAVADIVLAAADRPSWGTAMEIHHAFQAFKVVVVVCGAERVSPWLRFHSTILVRTLAEAFEVLLS